jgi:hypothetical protein
LVVAFSPKRSDKWVRESTTTRREWLLPPSLRFFALAIILEISAKVTDSFSAPFLPEA